MSRVCSRLLVCLCLSVFVLAADGSKCGELNCTETQYCDQHALQCRSCDVICDNGHNHDRRECQEQCTEYLYLHKIKMDDVVREVKVYLVVLLIIASFFVLVFFLYILLVAFPNVYRKYRRRQLKKKKEMKVDKQPAVVYQNDNARIRGLPPVPVPASNSDIGRSWAPVAQGRWDSPKLNSFYKPTGDNPEPIMRPLARRQPSEHSLNYFRDDGLYENAGSPEASDW